jgi:hypothetical protein
MSATIPTDTDVDRLYLDCDWCNGTGYLNHPDERCPVCRGPCPSCGEYYVCPCVEEIDRLYAAWRAKVDESIATGDREACREALRLFEAYIIAKERQHGRD